METDLQYYWRINELKNWIYCPRIPYYLLCLHLDRETAVSRIGIEAEQDTKRRMRRRKHALHAVHDGERQFDVSIVYHPLRLVGRLDEVVITDNGVYLVDYKDTDTDYGYWRIQMTAYRLGLQAAGFIIQGCFVYSIPDRAYHPVKSTASDEGKLAQIIEHLEHMIYSEVCPPPTPHHRKCLTCQYARFCNDIR